MVKRKGKKGLAKGIFGCPIYAHVNSGKFCHVL